MGNEGYLKNCNSEALLLTQNGKHVLPSMRFIYNTLTPNLLYSTLIQLGYDEELWYLIYLKGGLNFFSLSKDNSLEEKKRVRQYLKQNPEIKVLNIFTDFDEIFKTFNQWKKDLTAFYNVIILKKKEHIILPDFIGKPVIEVLGDSPFLIWIESKNNQNLDTESEFSKIMFRHIFELKFLLDKKISKIKISSCKFCRKVFVPSNLKTVFCDKSCKNKYFNKEKNWSEIHKKRRFEKPEIYV